MGLNRCDFMHFGVVGCFGVEAGRAEVLKSVDLQGLDGCRGLCVLVCVLVLCVYVYAFL